MQEGQTNALQRNQIQCKQIRNKTGKKPNEQVHVELVRGGILCAFLYHRTWPDYPGNCWDLVHAEQNLLETMEIDLIGQRRCKENVYAAWTCRKKDMLGHATDREIDHSVFIRKARINKPATPQLRKKWGELIAKACQGLWKFQRRCTFQFHVDHMPSDTTKMRYLSDIVITSDVLRVAKLCYPSKTLNQILADDNILGHFFPETSFPELRENYGTSNDVNRGSLVRVLKAASSWEH